LFEDPRVWHRAQANAFSGSVVAWVNVPEVKRHGLAGCGAPTPWQVKQDTFEPPPEKSAPWQIWQEANPEFPGAFLAAAPWTPPVLQLWIGPW
jgi:hypothetical protein